MRDLSYIIAFFATIVLLAAAAGWWNVVRDPQQRSTASHIEIGSRRVQAVGRATAVAFGLSGVAAGFAALAWIVG